ncbi:MAG: SDR family NAD(P)-dependent oxidoreductase, partial [Candidatus Promineifilaceae bacterium]
MLFEGKTCLVTGSSRGIGRVIAEQFADEGARIALHYHQNAEQAQNTLHNLSGVGHRVYQADIGDPVQVQKLAEDVLKDMGKIDILVNNAGVFIEHKVADIEYDQWLDAWDKVLALNLHGPANLMYWVSRSMMRNGGGRIINVSSRGAFRGEPEAPAYGASKAGLNAMSQSLAVALAPHNIFIGVVAPGFVETDMAADFLKREIGDDIRAQSPLG